MFKLIFKVRKHGSPLSDAACLLTVAGLMACCFTGRLSGQVAHSSKAEPIYAPKAQALLGMYDALPLSIQSALALSGDTDNLDSLAITQQASNLQAVAKTGTDPAALCQVLGPVRLMARRDIRFEILSDAPNKLVMLFENDAWGHVRTLGIDAPHLADFTKVRPMWNGDSVAVWQGDALVVDSIHFTDKTWLTETGLRSSKKLHLTERFRIIKGGRFLQYQLSASDADVLLQPLTYTRYFKRTTREITEYNCFTQKPPSGRNNLK